jgi:aminoglycoside phosphotransferase (APT) family kinase protein
VPPPEVAVDESTLRAIADRHGVPWTGAERLQSPGIINVVYGLGPDVVLRVPHDHRAHIVQAGIEAAAIPRAVAAGVRTPPLVAYDDSLDLLPVPYLLVARVPGRDVESRGVDPADVAEALRAVGRDLALTHAIEEPGPSRPAAPDGHQLIEERTTEGWLSSYEASWLHRWLDELERPATSARFLHGDVQLSNVIVDDDLAHVALLDWGCAVPGDPVIDFLPLPLRGVSPLLAGYREAGGEIDDARILRARLVLLLEGMRHGAAPGRSWGDRPIAWLFDLAAFGNSIAGGPPRLVD